MSQNLDKNRENAIAFYKMAYEGNPHKAVELYENWKDKPYESEPDFETFREVFLIDIDDLESKGITHPDFVKIRTLLEETTVEPEISE